MITLMLIPLRNCQNLELTESEYCVYIYMAWNPPVLRFQCVPHSTSLWRTCSPCPVHQECCFLAPKHTRTAFKTFRTQIFKWRSQLRRFALRFIHSHSDATDVFRNAFREIVALPTSGNRVRHIVSSQDDTIAGLL